MKFKNHLAMLLLALCAGFMANATAVGQEDGDKADLAELMQEANQALGAQDWDDAAKAFKKVTEMDKSNARAWHLLGYALHAGGKVEEAIPIHEKATKFEEFKAISLYNLGCAYSLQGKKQKSLGYLHKALDAGFDQLSMFAQDSDLENIRKSKGYKDIVARVRNGGARPKFDPEKMAGEWKIVKGVRAGKEVAQERLPNITITKKDITIPAGPEKFVMSYKVDAEKLPAKIDMAIEAGPAPAGSKAVGLIKMKAGNIVLCYDSTGAERPEKFQSTEENGFFMFVVEPVDSEKGDDEDEDHADDDDDDDHDKDHDKDDEHKKSDKDK